MRVDRPATRPYVIPTHSGTKAPLSGLRSCRCEFRTQRTPPRGAEAELARRIAIDITPSDSPRGRGPRRSAGGPRRGNDRSRAEGARKHRTDPKVRAKAEQLHENGMPFQMAMAVALGRVSLNDALERLARQERVDKTMEQHDLSRALATQIVIGHASLDAVLARRRLKAHRETYRLRSCLDAALAGQETLTLEVHGKGKATGVVTKVEAYSVTLTGDDGQETEIHKLQLKYAWKPSEWKPVKKAVRIDKALAAKPVEPIARPQDRYTCSDKRLFRYMDSETPVAVTLLEGEQIKGQITWFGRYEFGLVIKGGVEITVFRHALHELGEE